MRKEAGAGALSRYLPSPEAEFVEASSVEAIVLGRPIPLAKELGVSGEGYVMGLLDTVGEVKRLLLDAIMRSEIEKARRYFELMESLYSALSPVRRLRPRGERGTEEDRRGAHADGGRPGSDGRGGEAVDDGLVDARPAGLARAQGREAQKRKGQGAARAVADRPRSSR